MAAKPDKRQSLPASHCKCESARFDLSLSKPAVDLLALLCVLAISADLVANAANRSNEGALVSGIHFPAKIVDVHVDDIGHGVEIKFPDLFNNGGAGNGLALVAHQEFEQSKFLGAEIDVMSSAAHSVADAVDFEVCNLENRARWPPSPAQHSANTGGKFGKGERFRDVIVRASVETANSLLQHAGVGHDHHGQIGPLGADSAQYVQPADSRQIEIEKHEIVCRIESQLFGLFSVRNDMHGKLFLLQPLAQKFR